MFDQRDEIVCRLHLRDSYTHQHYGMLVCDVVRNIADAFNVHEDDVWQVVDHERRHHTADINDPSSFGVTDGDEQDTFTRRTKGLRP